MVTISFEFTVEITIEEPTEEVEVIYEEGVEYYDEEEYEVESDDDEFEYCEDDFECDDWETWGDGVMVPAHGWYSQGGGCNQMWFDTLRRFGGEVRGAGSDGVGEFDVYGSLDGHWCSFVKQYRGAHSVTYNGKFKNGVIAGTWVIPLNGDTGTFNIQPGWQKWKGKFYQGGGSKMHFDYMYVGDSGVTGGGDDAVGEFEIRGWKDGDNVRFCKSYIGQHQVMYNGFLDGKKLKGRWYIPLNGDSGKFKLKCNRNLDWN